MWWEVWGRESGCLCQRCFTALARERGLLLSWRPVVNSTFDEAYERNRDEWFGMLVGDDFLRLRLLALIDAAKGIEHTYAVTRVPTLEREGG